METRTRTLIKYLVIITLFILVILNWQSVWGVASTLLTIAKPLIYGFILAYVLNILINIIEPRMFPNTDNEFLQKIRRPLTIALSFLVIVAVLVLTFSLVLPQLINVITSLIQSVPSFVTSITDWINNLINNIPGASAWIQEIEIDWRSVASNAVSALETIGQGLLSSTISTITSVAGFIINLLLTIIISIYVLASKETLISQFQRFSFANLSKDNFQKVFYTLSMLNDSFKNFISGQVVEALILGMLIGVGMWIFQFPYALMIGVLTAVFALIPIIGAFLSGAVGFVLIFVQSPIQALWFIIFVVVIQQIEGNLIYPKVVGNSIGLPSLWVLVSTTVGGSLLGIPGFLIGVPTASFFYRLLSNNTRYKEAEKTSDQPELVQPPYAISASDDYQTRDIYYKKV